MSTKLQCAAVAEIENMIQYHGSVFIIFYKKQRESEIEKQSKKNISRSLNF